MLGALVLAVSVDLKELRAIWLTDAQTAASASRSELARSMDLVADAGANTVVVPGWTARGTLHPSAAWSEASGEKAAFEDGLAAIVFEAHRCGLEVLVVLDPGVPCASEKDCPVLAKRPEWPARKRDGSVATRNGVVPLNLLEPSVQDLVSRIALEVCRDYDVDGVVCGERLAALDLDAGHEPGTVQRYRKEHGKDPPHDAEDPAWCRWRQNALTAFLARLRKDVKAVDPGLVFAVAPRDAGSLSFRLLHDEPALLERGIADGLFPHIAAKGSAIYRKRLDEIVSAPWAKERLASVFPAVSIESDEWRKDPEPVLAAIARGRELGLRGESLLPLEPLRERNGELARALSDGPWAEFALPPWRAEKARRPRAPVAEPVAGEGAWGWRTREGEPASLELDGGDSGHVAWTLEPPDAGTYSLFTWISPAARTGSRAPYRIASAGGMRTITVDPSQPRNRGWVFLGDVHLEAEQTLEVARLVADEADATKVTTAGPVVALLDRRPKRR